MKGISCKVKPFFALQPSHTFMASDTSSNNPFPGQKRNFPRPFSIPSVSARREDSVSTPPSQVALPPVFLPSSPPVVSPPQSSSLKRFLWIGVAFLLIVLIGGGIFYWWRNQGAPAPLPTTESSPPKETPPETTPALGETPSSSSEVVSDKSEYASENFKAGDIAFGGELAFVSQAESTEPLEISNIRGEAFTEKSKQQVELVVTWTTNKLSLADVSYAKGVGQTGKTVSEGDYSFNHSLILTGLDPASTYLYTIHAVDRFGNEITSDPHAVFTGARTISLFDLIAGAIGDVFGWAVTK